MPELGPGCTQVGAAVGDDPHGEAVAAGLLRRSKRPPVAGGAPSVRRPPAASSTGPTSGAAELVALADGAVHELHLDVVGREVAEGDDRLDRRARCRGRRAVVGLDVVDVHAVPGRVDPAFQAASSRAAA